jgi:hypothetical protein
MHHNPTTFRTSFYAHHSDLSDQVGAVTFSLWDWDRASRNDFLGRVTLKKDDIPFNKYARPPWPALLVDQK